MVEAKQQESEDFKQQQIIQYTFLGEVINAQTNTDAQQMLFQKFVKTIWISYRKNFDPLIGEKRNFNNDGGWGCMLRAGQNLLTEGFKRHLKASQPNTNINDILQQVIDQFKDSPQSIYSIHNISEYTKNEFKLLPGQWYKPNQIAFALQELHSKKQLSGTENLEIQVQMSDRPIVLQNMLQAMCDGETKVCENQEHVKQGIVCEICHNQKFKKSLILYIICKIGLDEADPAYLKFSIQLLQNKFSIGVIGGQQTMALYFVGNMNQEIIYLDPHTVQDCDTGYNSYFCQNFKMININKIGTSLGFGFYIQDLKQLSQFTCFLKQITSSYGDDSIWTLYDIPPVYNNNFTFEEIDDDFIIID